MRRNDSKYFGSCHTCPPVSVAHSEGKDKYHRKSLFTLYPIVRWNTQLPQLPKELQTGGCGFLVSVKVDQVNMMFKVKLIDQTTMQGRIIEQLVRQRVFGTVGIHIKFNDHKVVLGEMILEECPGMHWKLWVGRNLHVDVMIRRGPVGRKRVCFSIISIAMVQVLG